MLRISISALALMSLLLPPSNAVAQHQTHAPAKPAVVAAAGRASKDTTAVPKTAGAHRAADDRTSSCQALVPLTSGRPIAPETAGPGHASFVDPTVRVESSERVLVGCRSYIGPFASIDASLGPIAIGHESNLQDNVVVTGKLVVIGDRVIIAHGATIMGPSSIGVSQGKPAFVGFNAYVDGAMIEGDAMVGVLARVGSGIILRAGKKVLPGKFVRTQAEADDSSLGKVASVTDADRAFMQGVLHVNTALAAGYTELFHASPGQLTGIGRDPGQSDFNATPDLPHLAGKAETHPHFRNRIIGRVEMASSFEHLATALGKQVAIRADEGEHFTFGHVGRIQDRVTFHALEHSDIAVGNNTAFGYHVVVHGGADAKNAPPSLTRIDDDVVVRDWAVVFRSTIGKGSVIGVRALVDASQLPPGTVVPDRTIMIGNKVVGIVEW